MGNVWLRRFALVTAFCTLLLIIAGGLVTSNDAALSITDWPLAYGQVFPHVEGGARFELAHRMAAATVALLTLILALWTQAAEPRRWLRWLAWVAMGTVLAQALLGGMAVTLVDPKVLAVAHACLAQLCFGLVLAVWVCLGGQNAGFAWPPADRRASVPFYAASVMLIQMFAGAASRHRAGTPIPHMALAVVVAVLAFWASVQVLGKYMEVASHRRTAMALFSLVFAQLCLGVGAYMTKDASVSDPQPMVIMVWFTVAHLAVGTLAFGAAVALALLVYRDEGTAHSVPAQGDMAVA